MSGFMINHCIYCLNSGSSQNDSRNNIIKAGLFYRSSDRKKVQRFRCKDCLKYFSSASFSKNVRQKKRHLNNKIARLLVAGVSQREGSKILKINRKTFVRKFIFMGEHSLAKLKEFNRCRLRSSVIQFDDMETFEHTKCKPLSIALAVEESSRRILHFEVSKMPAKGHLAQIAFKKYGYRKDERPVGRRKLFLALKDLIHANSHIKSDENPHYPKDVRRYFPRSKHEAFKGKRGAIVGQGELKKIGFDPLFSLNHTCATLRARMNRLFRRTWCTTKKPERLALHLALAALHHNKELIKNAG